MLTEAEVSKELEKFFQQEGWDYRKEWLIKKSGKVIDFLVKAPHDGGHIFFGVECKKDLNHKTNATVLADYLEQASAYSRDLGMPVFLAPINSHKSVSSLCTGGEHLEATASLLIFGGRQNVGGLVKRQTSWGNVTSTSWYMAMRGASFWDSRNGFNPKRLHMVESTGSTKERVNIKIWK